MRRVKHFAEHILASIGDGIVALDPASRVAIFNPAMEEMTGISSRRATGQILATLLPAGSSLPARVVATLETGQPFSTPEVEWQRRDGRRFPASLTIAPVLDKLGETLGAVLVVRDLRRVKELEESQRPADRLVAFSVFGAAMAHEIKNPLLGIRGAAQLLAEELADSGLREYSDVVVREADRLNALLEEMLDFARPHPLRRGSVNLHEVLDTVVTLERASCEARGVSCKQDYDPSLPNLWADRDRLVQVFLNLVRNAWEAMPHGGTLTLATKTATGLGRVRPAGGPMLLVEVSDEGSGISPEDQAKLFTPFYTTKAKGSGLGLVVSHKIIEEHGGRCSIKSLPGQGTTVHVYLPVEAESPVEGRRATHAPGTAAR
jgi:two-component system nitrogen regulation sensor histidine kinase GlnL